MFDCSAVLFSRIGDNLFSLIIQLKCTILNLAGNYFLVVQSDNILKRTYNGSTKHVRFSFKELLHEKGRTNNLSIMSSVLFQVQGTHNKTRGPSFVHGTKYFTETGNLLQSTNIQCFSLYSGNPSTGVCETNRYPATRK
jgi:hypothetical protein